MTDAEFVATADTWVAAQPPYRVQMVALAANVYANAVEVYDNAQQAAANAATTEAAQAAVLGVTSYVATSASSIEVSAGTKTVRTEEAGRAFAVDDAVVLFRKSDPDVRLYGVVATSDGSDDYTVDVTSDGVSTAGAGNSYTDWIMAAAWYFQTGATAAEVWALASALVALTPKAIADSQVEQALVDGATITPDFAAGRNFYIDPIGGNRTLANPTNLKVGQKGRIRVKQDGTGGRTLAYGSYWKRQGGAPVLSTAASAEDWIYYSVEKTDLIVFNIVKAPS